MAERQPRKRADGRGGAERVLIVMVASSPAALDELITLLLDLGLPGATVLESKGLGAILRSEMPIFSGLAAMIPEQTGSRVILSAASVERADELLDALEELPAGSRPIAFTTPIDRAVGLSR